MKMQETFEFWGGEDASLAYIPARRLEEDFIRSGKAWVGKFEHEESYQK
jgi:hypothetical protein